MSDNILRLRVDSAEYDAKLKRATDGLTRYIDGCRKVGGTLEYVEKETLDYVKALGNMGTVSTSATGKLSELKKAFVELSYQYKQMTSAEKSGAFGKALSSSLDKLKTDIKSTQKDLDSISKGIRGEGSGGLGALQVFRGNMLTKAAELASRLGPMIADIVDQSAELSKQTEGVQKAFERLGRGDLLAGLRQATHNTVSDFELMKAAVQFNDFNLPLEQLGTMLAFAQQKAKDTGQSVDYMVNSIVTGLGRQSVKILDNLGISAAEIKLRMKETGDMTTAVADIIRKKMAESGDYVETAADRSKQATVSLQNAMLQLGTAMRETFGYTGWNDVATSMKAQLVPVLTEIIGYLGEIKSFFGGKTLEQAQQDMYGTVGMPNELKADLETLKNTPVEDRQRKFAEIEQKYAKRYRDKLNEASSAGSEYQSTQERADNSSSAGAWAALSIKSFFQKRNTKDLYTEADAAAKILGLYRSEAHKILTPGPGKPAVPPIEIVDEEELPKLNKLQEIESKIAELTSEAMEADRMRLEVIRAEIAALQEQAVQYKTIAAYAGGNYYSKGAKVEDPSTWSAELPDKAKAKVDVAKDLKKALGDPTPLGSATDGKSKNKEFDVYKEIGSITSGVGNIVSNLENLGISVPDGINKILGGISSVTSILTTISTIMTAIQSIQSATAATSFIPFFANSGIVPKAADGYYVPGGKMSGDTTPVLANAGELILSRAAQGNLVSALSGSQSNADVGQPYVSGEQLFLVINNHLRRLGRGEIATTK